MPPISHKYIEKLQKDVADLDSWLSSIQSEDDGSANQDDLKSLYKKVYPIYQKSLALYQTTLEAADQGDEFELLRQDVANFNYWLNAEMSQEPQAEERQKVFTRANSISLKALGLYRTAASRNDNDPQEPAGDEPATLSGS